MKIETLNFVGGEPRSIEATQVLIRDRYGNPMAIALELGDGVYRVASAAEGERFQELVRLAGVDRHQFVDVSHIDSDGRTVHG